MWNDNLNLAVWDYKTKGISSEFGNCSLAQSEEMEIILGEKIGKRKAETEVHGKIILE